MINWDTKEVDMRPGLLLLFSVFIIIFTMLPLDGRAEMREYISTPADRREMSVTIYQRDLAVVTDKRLVALQPGVNNLVFEGISEQLRPDTVMLRSPAGLPPLKVVERNFDFGSLTPDRLLAKYVGKMAAVVKTHPVTGEESVEPALVLSADNGVVLRIGERIETGVPGRLIFPAVPDDLRGRPALTITLVSDVAQEQIVELSYLTSGLGWQAAYVAELDEDQNRLGLSGWVTITNTGGVVYNDARIRLVAGDIHLAGVDQDRPLPMQAMEARAAAVLPPEAGGEDYHLYALAEPATISGNQTKQVALFQAGQVGFDREYQLTGQDHYFRSRRDERDARRQVGVFLVLQNSRDNNLGLPLPKGLVRVFAGGGAAGDLLLVGEDRLDHTPELATIRLALGQAFDVTAVRQQTDFKKLQGFSPYNYVFESAHRIVLSSAKDAEITVKVIEPLPGDWQIQAENLPHRKESAAEAVWFVKVPAKGSATLTYRVKVQY